MGNVRTDIIWPFQFYGEVFVAGGVGLDAFDNGDCGEVLDEDYGGGGVEEHGMGHTDGKYERSCRGDPNVGTSSSARYLGSCCECKTVGKISQELYIPIFISVLRR